MVHQDKEKEQDRVEDRELLSVLDGSHHAALSDEIVREVRVVVVKTSRHIPCLLMSRSENLIGNESLLTELRKKSTVTRVRPMIGV